MSQAVVLAERIRTSIALGESHFREFKSALEGAPDAKAPRSSKEIAKDICSTLVGFANADGGELLVGVEDNGEISGISVNQGRIEYLLSSWKDGVHSDTPLSNVRNICIEIDGKNILYFSIPKSTDYVHVTSDGRCLQRRDLETVPIASEEIRFTRQERQSQEYDRAYVDGASPEDLDLDLVKILADQISAGMSAEKCLQYLDLADFAGGYLRLRRAALLLFARDPTRWHPRLHIRVMRVSGTNVETGVNYNISSDTYIEANIVSIVEKAWADLRPHLVQTKLSGEARFETRVIYPELACREALINAIAHRDYSQEGRGIEIYIFEDRMEVVSPGGLLSSLSIADLRSLTGAHQSRNAFVARVLREMGFMREVGEGMRRIFELMHSNELADPEISTDSDKFIVALKNSPIYRPEHILWLESFTEFGLSAHEKSIVVLGYNGKIISPNDIFNGLGLVDTEEYRKLVYSLQTKRILYSHKTKSQCTNIARRDRRNVRDIPRYGIQIPPKGMVPASMAAVGKYKERPKSSSKLQNEAASGLAEHAFDPAARMFLTNLPRPMTVRSVIEVLGRYDLAGDVTIGRRKNFAFVQMESEEALDRAIETLDGADVDGFIVVARQANPLSHVSSPTAPS